MVAERNFRSGRGIIYMTSIQKRKVLHLYTREFSDAKTNNGQLMVPEDSRCQWNGCQNVYKGYNTFQI